MKKFYIFFLANLFINFFSVACTSPHTAEVEQAPQSNNQYVLLSMQLLNAVKSGQVTAPFTDKLEKLDLEKLSNALKTDTEKKAFWINVYNAEVQILLKNDPSLFEDRDAFFKKPRVKVGGQTFSFDQMEHGFIRGSKVKLSMGYLNDPFAGKYEKMFRVSKTDPRVHFALNCGAKSCPEVAVYDAVHLDAQLNYSAEKYLKATTQYEPKEGKAKVTTLFSWFRGDFGGLSGVIDFLHKHHIIPQDADPSLDFLPYDWTLSLGNYHDFPSTIAPAL